MSESRYAHALPLGTILDGYTLIDVLGAGGFGITYLAEEPAIGRRVAVKEFLPTDIATRRRNGTTVTPLDSSRAESFAFGLERFQEEARTLVAFEHPNIVSVYKYFEANGTAYYAMRYVEGEAFDRLLGRVGTLAEDDLLKVLYPLLDGVEEVHAAGFLHRDIKPSNIFIRRNRQPILIDFGAARMALGEHSKSLTAILSPGYAPFEQYHARGNQGPWTDIYSLAATMYRCITARTPPDATIRIDALVQKKPDPMVPAAEAGRAWYNPRLLKAIDKALSVNETERPQSVAALRVLLPECAPVRARTGATSRQGPTGEPSGGVATWLEKNGPSAGTEPSQPATYLHVPPPAAPAPAAPAPAAPPQPPPPQPAAPQQPQALQPPPTPAPYGTGPSQAVATDAVSTAPPKLQAQPWLRRRSTRVVAAVLCAAVGAAGATYGILRWETGSPSWLAEAPRPPSPPASGRDHGASKETPKPPAPPKATPDAREPARPPPAKPPERADKPVPSAPATQRARALLTEPSVLWDKTYGTGDLRSAVVLTNGMIAVAGSTPGQGDQKDYRDTALSWIDSGGERARTQFWRRTDNNDVSRLLAYPDGSLAFAGSAKRKDSSYFKAWIVRLTASGRDAWERFFPDGNDTRADQAFDLVALEGGELVFVGQTAKNDPQGDGWAVMLDRNGKVIWDQPLGTEGRIEELRKIVVLSDGTLMAAGAVTGAGGRDRFWLVHLDRQGRVLGERIEEDTGRTRPTDMQPAGDGAIVAGWTQTEAGAPIARWLRKVDGKGLEAWKVPIPGEGSERIWRVMTLDDGGFVLIVSKFPRERGMPRIVRVDQTGRVVWEKQVEGRGMLRDVVMPPEGGLVAVGVRSDKADSEAWAIRLGYRE